MYIFKMAYFNILKRHMVMEGKNEDFKKVL